MSTLSKSPVAVARHALAVAAGVLRPYAHPNSPRTYTPPQLFACLVLKTFLRVDYRGRAAHLADHSDLRAAPARHRFRAVVHRFLGRRRVVARAALDSTGLDVGHASRYYVRRRSGAGDTARAVAYRRFAKLEAAFDCDTHLLLAALPGREPRPDADRLVPLLDAARAHVRVRSVLADAGYDSEANHRYARDGCGVRSFIPAAIGRSSGRRVLAAQAAAGGDRGRADGPQPVPGADAHGPDLQRHADRRVRMGFLQSKPVPVSDPLFSPAGSGCRRRSRGGSRPPRPASASRRRGDSRR